MTVYYPVDRTLPKAFGIMMRFLRLCPHANVGWPVRCAGEGISSQHCCDCGAQRTYTLQPNLQVGPWERPQLRLQLSSWNRLLTTSGEWVDTARAACDLLTRGALKS